MPIADLILMDVGLKGDMDGIRASELINEKVRVPRWERATSIQDRPERTPGLARLSRSDDHEFRASKDRTNASRSARNFGGLLKT